MKNLRKSSEEIYKKFYIPYLCLGLFFSLVAIACISLDFITGGIGLLLLILILFPILFGCLIQSYETSRGAKIEFKSFYNITRSYYLPFNYGCFRLLKCFLKALLVEILIALIITPILQTIFNNSYGALFAESYEAFYSFIYTGNNDIDLLEEILQMNDGLMSNFLTLSSELSTIFGIITFVICVSFNSIGVFLKFNSGHSTNPLFNKTTYNKTFENCRKKLFKNYWVLNWPLAVIFAFGFLFGALISIFALNTYGLIVTLGMIISFILLIPYFPIYLANTRVIGENGREEYANTFKEMIQTFVERLVDSEKISPEEKENILKSAGISIKIKDDDDESKDEIPDEDNNEDDSSE